MLLHGEPDLTVRVVRDVFNEDFTTLVVSGDEAWGEISQYVEDVAPDLAPRLQRWTAEDDVFAAHRIDEQLAKAMDRKVWLPSGGSLVIDRTEAMTVVDVNTGKFVGSGGNLEETVTKNNLEAAEEIVRQLRLRDIGGIIVIDFIDMVLECNRDLVLRRLLECLGRDRTKHQVAEVTSLGLVQMTRKRVGSGLLEVFSEQCEHCAGRGIIVHTEPIDRSGANGGGSSDSGGARSGRGRRGTTTGTPQPGNGGNGGERRGRGPALRAHRGPDRRGRPRRGPAPRRGRRARGRPRRRRRDRAREGGGRARRPSTPRPTPTPSRPSSSPRSSRRPSPTARRSPMRSPDAVPVADAPSPWPRPPPDAVPVAVEAAPVVAAPRAGRGGPAGPPQAWPGGRPGGTAARDGIRGRRQRSRRRADRGARPLIWPPPARTGSLDSRCAHRADVPCRKREPHQPVTQRARP